jgi:CheY-like chemotaxis protein
MNSTLRPGRSARPASAIWRPFIPPGRPKTVLIVDDEPTVRMLVTEVLEDLGYTAIEAADGAALRPGRSARPASAIWRPFIPPGRPTSVTRRSMRAADGAAGLRVLQSDARIDLLVTDVGLPGGMNGRQMADDQHGLAALGPGRLPPGRPHGLGLRGAVVARQEAIEAADGAAGLRVLQSDARIDLLVTDVGLPGGMNGRLPPGRPHGLGLRGAVVARQEERHGGAAPDLRGDRYRHRHGARGGAARLRPVLHHEAHRPGHGPRPLEIIERPRPVPWPMGFVVKNGSKARRTTSGAMPVPASTSASTPATRCRTAGGSGSRPVI